MSKFLDLELNELVFELIKEQYSALDENDERKQISETLTIAKQFYVDNKFISEGRWTEKFLVIVNAQARVNKLNESKKLKAALRKAKDFKKDIDRMLDRINEFIQESEIKWIGFSPMRLHPNQPGYAEMFGLSRLPEPLAITRSALKQLTNELSLVLDELKVPANREYETDFLYMKHQLAELWKEAGQEVKTTEGTYFVKFLAAVLTRIFKVTKPSARVLAPKEYIPPKDSL